MDRAARNRGDTQVELVEGIHAPRHAVHAAATRAAHRRLSAELPLDPPSPGVHGTTLHQRERVRIATRQLLHINGDRQP